MKGRPESGVYFAILGIKIFPMEEEVVQSRRRSVDRDEGPHNILIDLSADMRGKMGKDSD